MLSGLILSFSTANAIELKVEQVKDNRAIVILDSSMPVKPGDSLKIQDPNAPPAELSLENKPAVVCPPVAPAEPAPPVLRSRQHVMTWEYDSGRTKTKLTTGGVTTESTERSGDLEIGYLYNFGSFEVGAAYAFSTSESESGDDKSNAGQLGILVMANFLENIPGNDVIPYLGLGLYSYSQDVTTTVTSIRALGGVATVSAGLKWFPVGEILALNTSIYRSAFDVSLSGSGTGTLEMTRTGIDVGFLFYF